MKYGIKFCNFSSCLPKVIDLPSICSHLLYYCVKNESWILFKGPVLKVEIVWIWNVKRIVSDTKGFGGVVNDSLKWHKNEKKEKLTKKMIPVSPKLLRPNVMFLQMIVLFNKIHGCQWEFANGIYISSKSDHKLRHRNKNKNFENTVLIDGYPTSWLINKKLPL